MSAVPFMRRTLLRTDPSKTIPLIVPNPPGGNTDNLLGGYIDLLIGGTALSQVKASKLKALARP